MRKIKNLTGLTRIKLVVIIIIVVILAIIAVPKFFNFSGDSKALSEKSVVGGVRAGIQTYYAQNKAFPATLDSAANGICASTNICFSTVLSHGVITANWTKAGFTYTGPNGGTFTYAPTAGSFN